MLGAAPVSMGKSGRSLTSFGVSIPKAVVPNADAVAPNVAAGAGFGSSATLSSKEEIGLILFGMLDKKPKLIMCY